MEKQTKYDVFISYRRFDAEGRTSGRDIARTIKLELEKRKYKVFFDYSEIKDNEFEHVILPAVKNAKVFIVVLSKDALVRCKNEGDWVRREIETALSSGCKIIPVNPDNAFDGWPEELPESILPLTRQEISDVAMGSLFERSIDKLVEERISKVVPLGGLVGTLRDVSVRDIPKKSTAWFRRTQENAKQAWAQRNLVVNIIYCIYLLLATALTLIFLEILLHPFSDFFDLAVGFFSTALLYGVIQLCMNRRGGLLLILLSPIVVIPTGLSVIRDSEVLWSSLIFLMLAIIPLLLTFFIRKDGKSVWTLLFGQDDPTASWIRHLPYYLWCVCWVVIVILKVRQ